MAAAAGVKELLLQVLADLAAGSVSAGRVGNMIVSLRRERGSIDADGHVICGRC
jgi:hypothetical protein